MKCPNCGTAHKVKRGLVICHCGATFPIGTKQTDTVPLRKISEGVYEFDYEVSDES